MSEPKQNRVIKCNSKNKTTFVLDGINSTKRNSSEKLQYPYGLFVDNQKNVYITEWGKNRIQKFKKGATSGVPVAWSTDRGRSGKINELYAPVDIIVDKHGFMYIADMNNHRILRWKMGDKEGKVIFGSNGMHFLLFALYSM
jgi:DNA-binding beta-propeller fold protein YncE